ncbi:MAG: BamA/TamA family outer membrane protein [Bacteroidota bacterium]
MQLKITILVCLFPAFFYAQFRIDTAKRVNYLAIPILFRTPETGWAYGLSGSANFKTSHKNDTATRTSVITALGIFSERQQNVQGLDATIYFPKEIFILYFNSSHSYFPDNFWGIGQDSKNTDVERYVFEQVAVSPHLKKKFWKHTFFGLLADYQNVFRIQYTEGGLMDSTFFYGKTNYNITGLGATVSYDTRNSTFWPTKGVFMQTHFTTYNKEFASTYSFNKWTAEIRLFKKVFKNHVVAGHLYNYATFGETPYRSMASLGGAGGMRGFYQGRFRDNCMYSAIVEYRLPIWWRFSACVFGGVGDVYSKPKDINIGSLKSSFGGGLRISILEKEKLNLRIDYGYSDNYNKGLYFTIGECF